MALEKDELIKSFDFNLDWIAYLRIKVQANKWFNENEFTEIMEDSTLKVRIKANPEKWMANIEIIKFFKKFFWFNSVEIISGSRDSLKMLRVKKIT